MTVAAPRLALPALLDIANGLAAAQRPVESPGPTRWYLRLLATEAYEAWLLGWPPGSGIEPHDHGPSHGAFVVVSGRLAESRWHGGERRRRELGPGDVATVRSGVVHDVEAMEAEPGASIHVYSPPLTEMRFYADDGRTTTRLDVS